MHLKAALHRAGRTIHYTPVDAIDRGDASMLLCHFNLHEYPLRVTPAPSVLVMQGVLEYVYDKLLLLRVLRCAYPSAAMLLSYTVGHRVGLFEEHGWVAPLTSGNVKELLSTLGLQLRERGSVGGQQCMRLVPTPLEQLPPELCGGWQRQRTEPTSINGFGWG